MVRAHISNVKVVACEDLHCICGNAMQCNAMQVEPSSISTQSGLLFRVVAGLQTACLLLSGSVEPKCFHAIGRSRLCPTRQIAAFAEKLHRTPKAAQDTVSPSDHSGRVKLVLQAENATLVCPRTFSCLDSWPTVEESIGSISYHPRSQGFFGFARAFWSNTAMRKYIHQITTLYISLDLKQEPYQAYMKPSQEDHVQPVGAVVGLLVS